MKKKIHFSLAAVTFFFGLLLAVQYTNVQDPIVVDTRDINQLRDELKKQEEQQKLTEARIRQAGGDIPAEAPAEAAVPAAPKEKKPLSARWKEWWAAFPDRAREFFRPYSAEQGGDVGARGLLIRKEPERKGETQVAFHADLLSRSGLQGLYPASVLG